MAFAWSHDAMLADDLVQEALMLALQKIEQLKDESTFDGWMYTILNNVWLGHLRKSKPGEDIDNVVLVDNASPEQAMLTEQVDTMVREAMTSLPNAQRQVVTLVDLDGLSYSEVAGILRVPIGTVMSRLNRARNALMTKISRQRHPSENTLLSSLHSVQHSGVHNKLRVVK
ncbi:MAG TPA: sigma-70 family RNA polymerase sigma factor [Gammaproteobacteria bacterium]|nr:sigma-70 family RNA polymerase sigma factor [Gammaproteobacteria bacterium]